MTTLPTNDFFPQTDKAIQLNQKMLILAQELMIDELTSGTLIACGYGFTHRLVGKYGRYETFDGEVVVFEPRFSLNFILICEDFVVTSSLAMIKTISYQVEEYDLSIKR